MADRVGFEPTVRFHAHCFSRAALSTTQSPVLQDLFTFSSYNLQGYRKPYLDFGILKCSFFSPNAILEGCNLINNCTPKCLTSVRHQNDLGRSVIITSVNRGTQNRNGTLGWCRGKRMNTGCTRLGLIDQS